jgi:hypothetical protein
MLKGRPGSRTSEKVVGYVEALQDVATLNHLSIQGSLQAHYRASRPAWRFLYASFNDNFRNVDIFSLILLFCRYQPWRRVCVSLEKWVPQTYPQLLVPRKWEKKRRHTPLSITKALSHWRRQRLDDTLWQTCLYFSSVQYILWWITLYMGIESM